MNYDIIKVCFKYVLREADYHIYIQLRGKKKKAKA